MINKRTLWNKAFLPFACFCFGLFFYDQFLKAATYHDFKRYNEKKAMAYAFKLSDQICEDRGYVKTCTVNRVSGMTQCKQSPPRQGFSRAQ